MFVIRITCFGNCKISLRMFVMRTTCFDNCKISFGMFVIRTTCFGNCKISLRMFVIRTTCFDNCKISFRIFVIRTTCFDNCKISFRIFVIRTTCFDNCKYHFLYNRIFIPPIRLHCYYYQKSKIQWSYTMLVEFSQLILFLVMFFTLFNFKNVLHFSLQLKSPKTHKLPRLLSSKKPSYHLGRL